jgi:hypothetical protein
LRDVTADRVEVTLKVVDQRCVVERRGRVIERHVGDSAALDDAAAHAADRSLAGQQPLQRVPAQDEHDFRLHEVDLALQKRLAGLGFGRHRVPVLGRAALQDVRYVNVVPSQPDLPEERVQELAGGAHERLPLDVLVEAGRLPDDHDVGRAGPGARDRLVPGGVQPTAGAGLDLGV